MARTKVSKFYDGHRLIVGVRTLDPEQAKTIANEIFKTRRADLTVCFAKIRGKDMLYDCKRADANGMAVYIERR